MDVRQGEFEDSNCTSFLVPDVDQFVTCRIHTSGSGEQTQWQKL